MSDGDSARLDNCSEEAAPESVGQNQSSAVVKVVFHEVSSGVGDKSDLVENISTRTDPLLDPESLHAEDTSQRDHGPLQSDTMLTSARCADHKDGESDKAGSHEEETMMVASVFDSSEAKAQESRHFNSAGSNNTIKDKVQHQQHMEDKDHVAEIETSHEKRNRGSTSASFSVTVTQFVSLCTHTVSVLFKSSFSTPLHNVFICIIP